MHQNRASPFASDFYRRGGHRREFRSEGHFSPFPSQKKSRFASDFLRRGNRASWGPKESGAFWGSGTNRRRSRRESRDFGAFRYWVEFNCALSMRFPDPSPVLAKNRAPMGPEIYPVLGLGSGERLLSHFHTPVLYWKNFSLRFLLFPNSGHFPLKNSKLSLNFWPWKGSREAFFLLCSQYVFR